MARPWMPLYIADYRADTGHLTAAEHGAYLLLLIAIWQSPGCSIPADDRSFAKYARLTPKRWRRFKPTLFAFFSVEDGAVTPTGATSWRHADWAFHPCRWTQGTDWRRIREAVLRRDDFRCAYCGNDQGPFDIDHITPRSRGGTNDASNLACSCASCNRSKGARTLGEWRQ